jgi:hypothetical protein
MEIKQNTNHFTLLKCITYTTVLYRNEPVSISTILSEFPSQICLDLTEPEPIAILTNTNMCKSTPNNFDCCDLDRDRVSFLKVFLPEPCGPMFSNNITL